ncbi:hypothetical protein [Pseudoalteromonas arabiensis]|uniref:hypothetical protein n=1 Tax=Pseudoalteromonas arabiensis TaxID=874454 RepID=UPI00078626A7|nr:hypothetical protein [Pseudoalteromonas arabiensis]|tara:strand:- start:1729 stop:2595 length:867 start_codon:yes stop_codon:yes gene_type:complete
MPHQADNGIIDLFRERLASPFIFTVFWVSCTWNWKLIYWFINEPLKPSIKLNAIPYDWEFMAPLTISIAIIIFIPWLNNLVELFRRLAENEYNKWLHKHNWKEMISSEEHSRALEEIASLKSKNYELVNINEEVKSKENKLRADIVKLNDEKSELLNDIGELQKSISNLKSKLTQSESEASLANDEIFKLKNEINNSINDLNEVNEENRAIIDKNKKLEAEKLEIKDKKVYLDKTHLMLNDVNKLLNLNHLEKSNLNPILSNILREKLKLIDDYLSKINQAIGDIQAP